MRVVERSSRSAPASIREFLLRMARGQTPAVRVQRRQIPYWQERGWHRLGRIYNGSYQTAYGAFWGQIEEHPGGHVDFFVCQPPNEVRRSSHWPCFQHRGNDWYLVHMAKEPRDVSSGILTIERLIAETYES